jgi:hypothetical protein
LVQDTLLEIVSGIKHFWGFGLYTASLITFILDGMGPSFKDR